VKLKLEVGKIYLDRWAHEYLIIAKKLVQKYPGGEPYAVFLSFPGVTKEGHMDTSGWLENGIPTHAGRQPLVKERREG
jgi:hypothetical protein